MESVSCVAPTARPDFSGAKNLYERTKIGSEFILNTERIKDSSTAISGQELFRKVKDLYEDFSQVSENTFYSYLSRLSKDANSVINCLEKKQGYYLSDIAKSIAGIGYETCRQETDSEQFTVADQEESVRKRIEKESLLYPVLESWLIAQGYQAQDISKGKSLGKWGNPDISGVIADDTFIGLAFELTTIEVKTSIEDWEKWIFEAVSHRRFSNRSYFAFAAPEETSSKVPQEMRYYTELFHVGVLVISLENEMYTELQRGTLKEPLRYEDVDIIESFSAPFNFVQPKWQMKFCDALGITNIKKLYRFGKIEE